MIIKVRKGVEWSLFDEVDSIRYRATPHDEPLCMREDVLDFTERFTVDIGEVPNPNRMKWEIWFMNKNQTEETQLIAFSPIYLMNNQGKTVETL